MSRLDEYIKSKGKSSVDDLTDDEILSFFCDGFGGFDMKCQGHKAMLGIRDGGLKRENVVKAMRHSLKTKQKFECYYVIPESGVGPILLKENEMGWQLFPKIKKEN